MARNDAPHPSFPPNARALTTKMRGAALSVCRLSITVADGDEVDITMPAEDAFVALYQLQHHPAHKFRLNGKEEDVGPTPQTSLNLIDLSGEAHGLIRQPVDTLFFHLPRAALDEIAEDACAAKVDRLVAPASWSTTDPVIDQFHGLIVQALADGRPTNRLFHDHLLRGLGAHFAATYGGMRPHERKAGGLAPWQDRRARDMLAADLAGTLGLHEIAQECGLSAAYFSRSFKKSVGMTPHCWLQQRRIEVAKGLLTDRTLPLAEIALACGFADQSHFTRIFGRTVGMTPGAWSRLQ